MSEEWKTIPLDSDVFSSDLPNGSLVSYEPIEYEELEDIFVHYSNIVKDGYKTLKEGATVNFKLIETSKGLQAVDVCEKELTTI